MVIITVSKPNIKDILTTHTNYNSLQYTNQTMHMTTNKRQATLSHTINAESSYELRYKCGTSVQALC
jgi:hypothetical protein